MNLPCPTPSTPLRPPVLANANFNGPCIQPYYSPPPSTRKRKLHDENVFTAPGLTQHSSPGIKRSRSSLNILTPSERIEGVLDAIDGQFQTSCTIYSCLEKTQSDPTISRHLYWSTRETDGFSIIGFAGEFKKDDNECNENQLIMVLATAQAQRKALSLEPSIIMGATACRGRVQIFSSHWADDKSFVYIYEHQQQFDLSDPIQMILLYVFCSKLEKHLQSTLALELNTWSPPSDMVTLQDRKWRSPYHSRKRRRTEAGESTDGNSGGREGGNNGLVEADGLDNDWCMNIMKWRNEVVKDGKEGRVVPDEENILDAASGWLQFEGRAIAPWS